MRFAFRSLPPSRWGPAELAAVVRLVAFVALVAEAVLEEVAGWFVPFLNDDGAVVDLHRTRHAKDPGSMGELVLWLEASARDRAGRLGRGYGYVVAPLPRYLRTRSKM